MLYGTPHIGRNPNGSARPSGNGKTGSAGAFPCPGSHAPDATTDSTTPHPATVRIRCRLCGSPLGTRSTAGQARPTRYAPRYPGGTGATAYSLLPTTEESP